MLSSMAGRKSTKYWPLFLAIWFLHLNHECTEGQLQPITAANQCDESEMTGDCLRGIFRRYGNSENMDYDQFQLFLGNIGLGIGANFDFDGGEQEDDYSAMVTSAWDDHNLEEHTKCLSPPNLLATVGLHATDTINASQFLKLCPVLVQQIDIHACEGGQVSIGRQGQEDPDHQSEKEIRYLYEVWGFSVAAITVISLASLLCILMVPCIQGYQVAFQRLLAFLVALAVGTLSGDAILHLIPHSFIPHSHSEQGTNHSSEHDHDVPPDEPPTTSTDHLVIYKGLAVLCGVYLFFIFEQFLQYVTEVGSSLGQEKEYESLANDQDDPAMELSPDPAISPSSPTSSSTGLIRKNTQLALTVTFRPEDTKDLAYSEVQPLSGHCGTAGSKCQEDLENSAIVTAHVDHGHSHGHGHGREHSHGHGHSHTHGHGHSHGHSGHGHGHSHSGHGHSHGHSLDRDHSQHHHGHSHGSGGVGISSVAWIVVLGDSMHNLCDGIVVGSAFVDSLAGGISTTIAIMCHEIPHELGDFAVLLKGGMSIKQALLVQLLSSTMAYIGMVIGVAVGNMSSASSWMFALAAGMFLYIALVDLVPQMVEGAKNSGGSRCTFMALQTGGVVLGIGLMLMIALCEPRLLELLGG